jgi:GWxTD domain-containing protein
LGIEIALGRQASPPGPPLRGLRISFALLGFSFALSLASSTRAGFDVKDALPDSRPGRPRFLADATTYLGPNGPEVLLAFQVAYSELFFRPTGGRFRSDFDLIMLLDRGGEQVAGDLWRETRDVADNRDSRLPTVLVRRVQPFPCPPGRYTAEVTVRETEAGREKQVSWEIEVPDYAGLPLSLSSFWVAPCSEADSIPVPPVNWTLQRSFGENSQTLCLMGEVYHFSDEDKPVRLVWRIRGTRSDEISRGDLTVGPGSRIPFQIRPDLSTLWLGRYTFELEASCAGEHARRSLDFEMQESAAAMERDPAQSIDLVALIATPEEVREIREAPPPERKEAWNRFWKRHDPTPETPENEFKDEFFARVRYAEEHFAVMGEGWRTDRGRIYIQDGPPDQIESYPSNINTRPYEVWIYEKLGRRYVFVDYDGFGRYELYQPGRP